MVSVLAHLATIIVYRHSNTLMEELCGGAHALAQLLLFEGTIGHTQLRFFRRQGADPQGLQRRRVCAAGYALLHGVRVRLAPRREPFVERNNAARTRVLVLCCVGIQLQRV